jgi:hypothetical protein
MNAADALVQTPVEKAALAALRDATGETDGAMERHCVRCFRLSEMLAAKHNADLDREVMLVAAFLHDVGLYDKVSDGGVYTEEGGEFARALGIEHGWDARRADLCAMACAMHHSITSKWEEGAEVEVLRLADRIEVYAGHPRSGLERSQIKALFEEVPRDGFYSGIAGLLRHNIVARPLQMPKIFKP